MSTKNLEGSFSTGSLRPRTTLLPNPSLSGSMEVVVKKRMRIYLIFSYGFAAHFHLLDAVVSMILHLEFYVEFLEFLDTPASF